MSQASIEIVREFFIISNFFVLKREDVLLVKNSLMPNLSDNRFEKFVLPGSEIPEVINNAIVKPVSWHTMKFTPAVLKKSPELFTSLKGKGGKNHEKFFKGEAFLKILVIPSLPASESLRKESIKIMQDNGIDYLITFSSVISGLIGKIDARHVYLSTVNEVFRVLKFYRFFDEEEQKLPF